MYALAVKIAAVLAVTGTVYWLVESTHHTETTINPDGSSIVARKAGGEWVEQWFYYPSGRLKCHEWVDSEDQRHTELFSDDDMEPAP